MASAGDGRTVACAVSRRNYGQPIRPREPSRGGRGNDVTEIERGRHSVVREGESSGGSNYAMADGSARYIRFKGGLYPLNLWAVTDDYREEFA